MCYKQNSAYPTISVKRVTAMNRNQKIFESESVWKSIFAMAVPSLITILVMLFYNMADMFFIGQLGNTSYVAAVSLVTPMFSMLMAVASMIGAGGSAECIQRRSAYFPGSPGRYHRTCFNISVSADAGRTVYDDVHRMRHPGPRRRCRAGKSLRKPGGNGNEYPAGSAVYSGIPLGHGRVLC